jgi:hypothetical protein
MASAPAAAAPATACTAVALKDPDAVGVGPALWEAACVRKALKEPLAVALTLAALVDETDAAPLALAVALPDRVGVPDVLCVADAEVDDDGCRVADCKKCKEQGGNVPNTTVSRRIALSLEQHQQSTPGYAQRPGRAMATTSTALDHNTARPNPAPTMQPTTVLQQAPTSVAVHVPDSVWVVDPEAEADVEALEEGLAPELGLCSAEGAARRQHVLEKKGAAPQPDARAARSISVVCARAETCSTPQSSTRRDVQQTLAIRVPVEDKGMRDAPRYSRT